MPAMRPIVNVDMLGESADGLGIGGATDIATLDLNFATTTRE